MVRANRPKCVCVGGGVGSHRILYKNFDIRLDKCLCLFGVLQKTVNNSLRKAPKPVEFGVIAKKRLAYKKCALTGNK